MIFHWLLTFWFWLELWAAPLWWGGGSESCWTETRLEKWIKENIRQALMEGAELICCWLSDIFENHSKIYTEQDWNWLFGTTPVSVFRNKGFRSNLYYFTILTWRKVSPSLRITWVAMQELKQKTQKASSKPSHNSRLQVMICPLHEHTNHNFFTSDKN